MKLPKEITTITPLSKGLALFLFFMMPIVGFYVGVRYQEKIDLLEKQLIEQSLTIERAPTPSPIPPVDTSTWKTYKNTRLLFSISYPSDWEQEETDDTVVLSTPLVTNPNGSTTVSDSNIGISLLKDQTFSSVNAIVEVYTKKGAYLQSALRETPQIYYDTIGKSLIETGINEKNFIIKHVPGACGQQYVFILHNSNGYVIDFNCIGEPINTQILRTFKFTPASPLGGDQTQPTPTCIKRPSCLDATPRCMIPEPVNGWCSN